jgi:hypothetical protein
MLKMQSWDHVEFECWPTPIPEGGEPFEVMVSPAETFEALRDMLKDHFPEGPAAAVESFEAYRDWRQANATVFFKADKDRPQIADVGRRWRALVNGWENFRAKEQWMSGRVHARPDLELGLKLVNSQAMQKSSWRDRRANASRNSNDQAKKRER